MRIKINLNDYILVEITEYGWKELNRLHGKEFVSNCIENKKVRIDEINGIFYHRLQIHSLIQWFGGIVWNSFPSPCKPIAYIQLEETTITIIPNY